MMTMDGVYFLMRVRMFALQIGEKKREKCEEGFDVFFLFFVFFSSTLHFSFVFFFKRRRSRTRANRRSSSIIIRMLRWEREKSPLQDCLQAFLLSMNWQRDSYCPFTHSKKKERNNALVSQLVILSLSVAVGKFFSHNREGVSERERSIDRRKRWNIVERKRVSEWVKERRKKRNDMN